MLISKIIHSIFEAILGRAFLWRVTRAFYLLSRRDGSLDFDENGERELVERVVNLCKREARPLTVFDVGANYGDWVRMIEASARRANLSGCKVYGFEPNPVLAKKLCELASELEDTVCLEVINAAVSNISGRMDFVLASGKGVHHLATEDLSESGKCISAEVTTLDEFDKERNLGKIDMIKIDVEGFDTLAISGAQRLINEGRVDVIQFEYGSLYVRTRSFLFDVIKQVDGTPYKVGRVTKKGIELYEFWHPDVERFYGSNYAVVHERAWKELGARVVHYDKANTYA